MLPKIRYRLVWNYANISALATGIADVYEVASTSGIDANNIRTSGKKYICNGTCISKSSNLPTGVQFGYIEYTLASAQWGLQTWVEIRTTRMFIRSYEDGSWRNWKEL